MAYNLGENVLVDIIMYGDIYGDDTYTTAESYLSLAWVGRIILSTWEDQRSWDTNYRIVLLKSKRGDNLINTALSKATTSSVLILRTDRRLLIPTLKNLYDKFMRGNQIDEEQIFFGSREGLSRHVFK